mmetsp:Transcript_34515/g.75536  ORF Transcript_34515/g.75536 Transcript_34515/m.75536 type:complete len:284 (-) Transcript_34515:171-1022(-)
MQSLNSCNSPVANRLRFVSCDCSADIHHDNDVLRATGASSIPRAKPKIKQWIVSRRAPVHSGPHGKSPSHLLSEILLRHSRAVSVLRSRHTSERVGQLVAKALLLRRHGLRRVNPKCSRRKIHELFKRRVAHALATATQGYGRAPTPRLQLCLHRFEAIPRGVHVLFHHIGHRNQAGGLRRGLTGYTIAEPGGKCILVPARVVGKMEVSPRPIVGLLKNLVALGRVDKAPALGTPRRSRQANYDLTPRWQPFIVWSTRERTVACRVKIGLVQPCVSISSQAGF